jgi:hypothetical protein
MVTGMRRAAVAAFLAVLALASSAEALKRRQA